MPRVFKEDATVNPARTPQSIWKNKHFWSITVLMLAFTVFYYMDALINAWGTEELKWSLFYTVHDLHRSLFIIPVLYSAYFFRFKGVSITLGWLLVILLPRSLWLSPYPDPLLRALVFYLCVALAGLFLAFLANSIIERRRLEHHLNHIQKELLRETHDYLENLINYSNTPIVSWDRELRITEFNTAFQRLTGYTGAETLGQPLTMLFPEERRESTMAFIQETLAGRQWESEEIPVQKKDGSQSLILWNSANIYDRDSGELVTTFAQGQDISKLKQAEARAREESLWRHILTDQSRDGIVVLDAGGRVYETNRQFAHMLGYTPEEVYRLAVWDWDAVLPKEKINEMILTVDERGDHFETRHRRKDGTLLDVEISTNGAEVAGQKLIFCICRDITTRNRAEYLLRQSEAKYQTLVEQSNDSILIIENGILRFINSKTTETLGIPVNRIVGHSITEFLPEEEGPAILERHLKRLSGDQVEAIFETNVVRPDGDLVPVEINAGMTVFQERPAVLAIMRNISERKLAQAKTIEMEALKRVDLAKSELLANISHELRTPLASIKGFIETLLETDVVWSHNQQIDFLKSADAEADRLSLLIRDLLDMARIDSGRLTLDKRLCSVNELIDSIYPVLGVIASKHKLKIPKTELSAQLLVDKNRIGQVIANLVDNAAKFSAEGSLISILARTVNSDLVFTVEDHGIGIDPESVPHLFDRFYQSYQVVNGKTRGTGLGLTICKSIVEAHNGRLWVDSRPGKGSRFHFSLPLNSPERTAGVTAAARV